VAESITDLLAREYEFLRENRAGRDFFLELRSYAAALQGRRRIRQILARLEREVTEALSRFVKEENAFIDEAKQIRRDLAERAPEIDNSGMTKPSDPASDPEAWTRYELDSFAHFDELARRDLALGYPLLPHNSQDSGPFPRLMGILRGRLHAAEYGEDGPINVPKIRNDLDDIGQRIGNLSARESHAVRRYRQEALTLPGLAFGRLVYFGEGLNPEPTIVETDEDIVRAWDRTLREWGSPKRVVQKLVNGEQMDGWEQQVASETEQFLKSELDRLQQELTRQVAPGPAAIVRFLRDEWVVALGSATIGGVLAVLILAVGFGIGD
jgi:hypothetical protein